MTNNERGIGLQFRGVAKHYGTIRAVDGVDLDVPRGEFLTLLGPSGSGKTTMLMMIAGFTGPTEGRILLDGRDITDLPPEKRNFGMVFQGYALFPHLSVFDNVAFPLKVRRKSQEETRERVGKALDLVQLNNLADRNPRQLSGGQQQRVALARALVFNPEILLLDEPLGALDRKLRQEVQIELKELHRRVGTTFIYVTHDQEEALSMSDRIAIVRDGKFVQIGTPDELYERPKTRFVAGFLGESNFLKGQVNATANGDISYDIGGASYRQKANGRALASGEEILIAMRPEKVRIDAVRPAESANAIEGTVRNWNYFGSSFHMTLGHPGIGDIVVSCPAWRTKITPENGARLWVGWDADAGVVVDDD
ncbi:MAG: ABC transporter ATP-binding protein [Rhodospirillaceae bacterium]|nr:ABC transporter ATP-binding protein [Rhodospirillaceae bacterium]